MATTAATITDDAGWSPFYVLRISGLPYVFCATINPFDSAYGADAWTLGSGVTAVRGMQVPDDQLTQDLKDIVGGVASAERVRLSLQDFDIADSTVGSSYKFLGRLFAVGRALSDTANDIAYLTSDIEATDASTAMFTVTGPDSFSGGTVYIGGETLSYSSATKSGDTTTFTIDTRNLYPCVNVGSATYPPVPYHRYVADTPGRSPPVTSQPLIMVGRTAALYVGHMRPTGKPETEANAMLRLVGRIQSLEYQDGQFMLEVESVAGELQQALAAPGLPYAQLEPRIYLHGGYNSMAVGVAIEDVSDGTVMRRFYKVTLGATSYSSIGEVILALNAAIPAQLPSTTVSKLARELRLDIVTTSDGTRRMAFEGSSKPVGDLVLGGDRLVSYCVAHTDGSAIYDPTRGKTSLLTALGFDHQTDYFESVSFEESGVAAGDYRKHYVIADKPPPQLVFPATAFSMTAEIKLASKETSTPGARFAIAQGWSGERGWVRLGNGMIFQCTGRTDTTVTLGERNYFQYHVDFDVSYRDNIEECPAYYVAEGSDLGTIEQVVCAPDPNSTFPAPDPVATVWRLLCSTWRSYGSGYDSYGEGYGLGLSAIVDETSMLTAVTCEAGVRTMLVDRQTKWIDLFAPIAKEHHLFLVWSPADSKFVVRRLHLPTASDAATYQFTESNRARPADTTQATWDFSMMRTAWTIKYGKPWRGGSEYKKQGTYNDDWASSAYGSMNKSETIEDPSMMSSKHFADVISSMVASSIYYRYPWLRCTRTLNKTGLALSPGTIHKVIDATIHNPYTGILGIVSGDNVYGYLTGVRSQLSTGDTEIEFLIPAFDVANLRPWSPCALVNYGASNNGYVVATKTLTLKRHYTANSNAAYYDGVDFVAGDKVRLTPRDADGAPLYNYDAEVASVASDGLTMVLTTDPTGGSGLTSTYETIVTLQPYGSATASRQSGVSWMGDGTSNLIVATARVNKYQ